MNKLAILPLVILPMSALAADPTGGKPKLDKPSFIALPAPVQPGSPICTIDYNPDKPVAIAAPLGDQVGFQFGEGESIEGAFATDTVNLQRVGTEDLITFKAIANSGKQSILFRTHTPEGREHTYSVIWTTLPDAQTQPETRVASNGPAVPLGGAGADQQPYCLIVRWTYAAEARAKQLAAWRQQNQLLQSRKAEAELQHAAPPTSQNRSYSIRGDASLIPQVKQ